MNKKPFRMEELESSGARCLIKRHRLSNRYSIHMHWHDYFELEILLSGNATHICNGQKQNATKGDVWLLSQLDFHAFVADEPVEIINISLDRGFLSERIERMLSRGAICSHLDPDTLEHAYTLCKALQAEQANGERFCELALRALTEQLVILILRNAKSREGEAVPYAIRTTIAYLHDHFLEDVSVEQLALRQGLSTNYFGMLFRSVTGVSLREYLNKLRLRYACNLLQTTEMPIKEIAGMSGYHSVEYFFSVFRRQLAMTPQEYRERIRSN